MTNPVTMKLSPRKDNLSGQTQINTVHTSHWALDWVYRLYRSPSTSCCLKFIPQEHGVNCSLQQHVRVLFHRELGSSHQINFNT